MSETTGRERGAPRRSGSLRVLQLPAIIWLTVVWVALWGELSLLVVAGGAVVAVIVCLVFPLPRLPMEVRIHPLHLIWLLVHFLGDVAVASAQVSWTTLQFRRTPRNAVIEVDLRTDSDLILTVVGEMVSLVPGSLVVEARRSTHTLFLHVLDARDEAGVAKMRRQVDALEGRVERALAATPRPSQEVTR